MKQIALFIYDFNTGQFSQRIMDYARTPANRLIFNHGPGLSGMKPSRLGVFEVHRHFGFMYVYHMRDLDYYRDKAVFMRAVVRRIRRLAERAHIDKGFMQVARRGTQWGPTFKMNQPLNVPNWNMPALKITRVLVRIPDKIG